MKKAILLFTVAAFFLTLAPVVSNAQFIKGGLFVEGGLGRLSVSNNKVRYEESNGIVNYRDKTNGFSIGIFPRVGFFVTNNLAVGTTLGLNYSSYKSTEQNVLTNVNVYEAKSSAIVLDFMPFARYYFGKSATTRFYGQVGGGISLDLSRKNEGKSLTGAANSTTYNYPKKLNTISGEALVGLNHFISTNVAINAALGYRYNSSKETTTRTSTYTFSGTTTTTTSNPEKYISQGGAISWNVGFTMFIPGKKKK